MKKPTKSCREWSEHRESGGNLFPADELHTSFIKDQHRGRLPVLLFLIRGYILFISGKGQSLQKGVKVFKNVFTSLGSAVFRLSALEPVSRNNNFKPCTFFILPALPDRYASTFKDFLSQEEAEGFSIPRPPLKEVNFIFR